MADENRRRDEQALAWVRRLHDPDFADWDAHIAWLEADRVNAPTFDRMLILVEDATANLAPPLASHALPAPAPANDNADVPGHRPVLSGRGGRRGWGWG